MYSSRAIAITDEGDGSSIVRIRETVDAVGTHTAEENVVRLDLLHPATLEDENPDPSKHPGFTGFPPLPNELGSTV